MVFPESGRRDTEIFEKKAVEVLARVYAAHLGDGINGILRIFREQLGSIIHTQLIDMFREAVSGLFLEMCAEKRGGDVQFLLQGFRRDARLQIKLTDRYLMQCMFQKFLFICLLYTSPSPRD